MKTIKVTDKELKCIEKMRRDDHIEDTKEILKQRCMCALAKVLERGISDRISYSDYSNIIVHDADSAIPSSNSGEVYKIVNTAFINAMSSIQDNVHYNMCDEWIPDNTRK